MTQSLIVEQIHTFIRERILLGQDAGLSATTPLLDLGILDSMGIIKLIAHLNERYHVEIRPDEIVVLDFNTIESVANLVTLRLESVPQVVEATEADAQPEGVFVFEVPTCAQVFVVFSGVGDVGITGRAFAATARQLVEDSTWSFNRAGLGNRNLILLHDPTGRNYKHGISSELPTPETIFAWLSNWLERRPHIEEIYCLGISAGGLMAMVAGHFLKAKMVWSFAPRPCRVSLGQETLRTLARLVQAATGKTVEDLQTGMTERDRELIDAQFTEEVVQWYYSSLLDPDGLLDAEYLTAVVETLRPGNGMTEHRVYYVQRDVCDARIVHSLQLCRGVVPVPVTPYDPPPPVWPFSRWLPPMGWVCRDHYVVDLLQHSGEFNTLFPGTRPAASIQAAAAPIVREHV
jgi:acyl carrier protein